MHTMGHSNVGHAQCVFANRAQAHALHHLGGIDHKEPGILRDGGVIMMLSSGIMFFMRYKNVISIDIYVIFM